MTVVSLRCHDCDTVKDASKVEIMGNGNMKCDECKTDEKVEKVKEADAEEEESEVEDADRDTDEETGGGTTENAEREKKPLKETFNEQDPLEW